FDKPGAKLPRIFHVNWFRKNADGRFLWPGFGENLRVLEWILERCAGRAGARDTAIGAVPRPIDLNLDGLAIDTASLDALLEVDPAGWQQECRQIEEYLDGYGARAPDALRRECRRVAAALATPAQHDNRAAVPAGT
ncbi:MAG TPA: phosphoenolpyruvate carboxykinase domain-containing protein, partial [Xanthomonadales bacterium]|nr:phosphoenolpyruvate carboxykinase domain-containing protein [Xanthomonadales bacterium]